MAVREGFRRPSHPAGGLASFWQPHASSSLIARVSGTSWDGFGPSPASSLSVGPASRRRLGSRGLYVRAGAENNKTVAWYPAEVLPLSNSPVKTGDAALPYSDAT